MAEDPDPRSELWGLEWDFLAIDSAGHIAVLTSAGYGLIPDPVLEARDLVERAVAQLGALSGVTRAIVDTAGRNGDYSEWHAMSERGLFAYDWQMWNGPYRRISAPAESVDVASLPDDVKAAAGILTVPYAFAGAAELRLP